ncbi:hypothetical protein V8F20_003887 [Naviculisporaceae sp. PSN 640]
MAMVCLPSPGKSLPGRTQTRSQLLLVVILTITTVLFTMNIIRQLLRLSFRGEQAIGQTSTRKPSNDLQFQLRAPLARSYLIKSIAQPLRKVLQVLKTWPSRLAIHSPWEITARVKGTSRETTRRAAPKVRPPHLVGWLTKYGPMETGPGPPKPSVPWLLPSQIGQDKSAKVKSTSLTVSVSNWPLNTNQCDTYHCAMPIQKLPTSVYTDLVITTVCSGCRQFHIQGISSGMGASNFNFTNFRPTKAAIQTTCHGRLTASRHGSAGADKLLDPIDAWNRAETSTTRGASPARFCDKSDSSAQPDHGCGAGGPRLSARRAGSPSDGREGLGEHSAQPRSSLGVWGVVVVGVCIWEFPRYYLLYHYESWWLIGGGRCPEQVLRQKATSPLNPEQV